jgi:hypothetical protein
MMRRAAIGLIGMLLVSGCVVARVDLSIDADGTLDGEAEIAYRKAFLEASATSAADAQQGLLADLTDDAVEGLTCLPFQDAETIGASCTLTDVPAVELSQLDIFDRRMTIARVDDRIVVDSVIDLTEFEPDPANPLDAMVKVTFSGRVIEQTGGSTADNAVSWTPRLGERLEAHAVAEASPRDAPSVVAVAIAAVVAVAMAGVGAFLLARRR